MILINAPDRPEPIPDLPWREHLDPKLGPPRYESAIRALDLTGSGIHGDAVRLIEQRHRDQEPSGPGIIQPLIFRKIDESYVYIPSDGLLTSSQCYRSVVTLHRLTGSSIRDLVIRWIDLDGYHWLAVLTGNHIRYRLARWSTTAINLGPLGTVGWFAQDGTNWRTTPIHRLTFRSITGYTGRMPPVDPERVPMEEIVEELWLYKEQRDSGFWGTFPEGILSLNGINESATWVRLTRVWRWQIPSNLPFGLPYVPGADFAIFEQRIEIASEPSTEESWP